MKPPWLSSGLPVLCPSKPSMSPWPCAESFVPLLQFGLCSEASSLQPWGLLLPDSRNLSIFSQDSAQAPKEETSSEIMWFFQSHTAWESCYYLHGNPQLWGDIPESRLQLGPHPKTGPRSHSKF